MQRALRQRGWSILIAARFLIDAHGVQGNHIQCHDAASTPRQAKSLLTITKRLASPTSAGNDLVGAPSSTVPASTGTTPSLAALESAAAQLDAHCRLLVATAVFEGTALLRQPHYCGSKEAQTSHRRAQRGPGSASAGEDAASAAVCHVAFVDWQSERLLKQMLEGEFTRDRGEAFIGCWQLLRVPAGLPYTHGAANALLAQAWLPVLFANRVDASWWVDAARQIKVARADDMSAPLDTLTGDAIAGVRWAATRSGNDTRERDGDGDGAPLDTSLVLRRHAPSARASALAAEWWRQWEAVASAHTPSREPLSRPRDSGARAAAAEHAASARAAAAALATVHNDAEFSAAFAGEGQSSRWPALSAAHPPRAFLPAERPVDATWRDLWPAAPLSARRTVAPVGADAPTAEASPPVVFTTRRGGGDATRADQHGFAGSHWGGNGTSAAERDAALSLVADELAGLPCAFMRPSVYDAAARVGSTHAAACEIVTLTAVFDAYDKLIQPAENVLIFGNATELNCFYAFVDRRSHDLLLKENRALASHVKAAEGAGGAGGADAAGGGVGVTHKVGIWHLVLLDGPMPYASSRRNSRVPKMLAHRLFPDARHALWLDSKHQLRTPPSTLRELFLPSGVVVAVLRNFVRDRIDEERDWVMREKCADNVYKCSDVIQQWATYEAEQAVPTWYEETVAIEGSLLLQDLRAPLHSALFCSWFNEYDRFGERDQLTLSYVMHRMGLTRRGANASRAVRFIERKYHYFANPSKQPLKLVTRLGHRSGE